MRILTFVILLVLTACGRPGTTHPEDRTTLLTGAFVDGGDPLSTQNQGIAYRVCFALRAKRFHYQGMEDRNDAKQFRFEMSSETCQGQSLKKGESEFTFKKDENGLEYDYSSDHQLFYGPLTDKQGLLSPLCEKILKGETTTNTFITENYAYEVSFFTKLEGDGVLIRFGAVDPTNEFQYNPTHAHYYHILTDTTVSGDMLGLIHRAEEVSSCEGNQTQSEIIQLLDL